MQHPPVTLVVVPRERFQFTQAALESLYENTTYPFQLIYIDNHSPPHVQDYLAQQAEQRGFQLIRSAHYFSPNQARNLGLRQVKTPYVCFLDNDVLFSPGWLTALVGCSQATGATVVGSLVCQYRPLHTIVHCVGGDYMNAADYARFARGERGPSNHLTQPGQWQIEERTYFQNQPIAEVADQLTRRTTGFVEFHAMLVRTSVFNRIGLLDEGFTCTKEYLDFCMAVTRIGGIIYFEPASIVTFLTHPPAPRLLRSDLPYFMLRWSDDWERSSLLHFQTKWNLADNGYFRRRYKKLGQRRRKEMIKPISAKFSFLGKPFTKWLENQLVKLEKMFNQRVAERYREEIAASHLQPSENSSEQGSKAHPTPICFPELPDRRAYLLSSLPTAEKQFYMSEKLFEIV